MKNRIRPLFAAALAAVALLALPACSSKQESAAVQTSGSVTGTVSTVANAIPATFKTKLSALIAAHPTASKYAADVAGALNKASVVVGDLPSPSTLNLYLIWTKFDPDLTTFAADFEALYSEFYSTFPADGAALSQIAGLISPATASTN